MNEYLEFGKEILRTLKQHNHQAFFVGGYVRDYKLNLRSNDIDITTSATPDEVISLFENVKETGKNFGGVTVLYGEYKYEVTTFRLEGKYHAHRYPKTVSFSKDIKDDLKRRDFTINQLIMDEFEEVYDHHNGMEDLNNRVIRTIGNAKQRFDEDALRILRAFKFVSKLGFDIESDTLKAIEELKDLVTTVKVERILNELVRIIGGDHQKKALAYMNQTGVSEVLGLLNGFEKIVEMKEYVYPIEAFIICQIMGCDLSAYRFSNRETETIEQAAFLHKITKEDSFNKFMLFSHKLNPCMLVNKINVLMGYKDQREDLLKMVDEMPVMDVCDLKFKGQDILQLTTLENKRLIGLVIDDILEEVIMNDMPNDYDVIKKFALQRIEEIQKKMGV